MNDKPGCRVAVAGTRHHQVMLRVGIVEKIVHEATCQGDYYRIYIKVEGGNRWRPYLCRRSENCVVIDSPLTIKNGGQLAA